MLKHIEQLSIDEQSSFLFPFHDPSCTLNTGRYGVWTAFLALLVRLFFFLQGELELAFVALHLLIVTPYDVMKLRGTQQGARMSLLIAGYGAFQHFSRASLRKAFDQGSIVATLAVVSITIASLLLLI